MSNARNIARLLPNSSGQLSSVNVGAGMILQVVPLINTTTITINTATPVQILAGSITVRQGSRILILSDTSWFSDQGASWNNAPSVYLYENGAQLAISEHQGVFNVSGASSQSIPLNYITGAKSAGTNTYSLRVNHVLSNTGGQVSRDSRATTLTLLEIAQ